MTKVKRTKKLRAYWSKNGFWHVFPTINYEHMFDPLTIRFHFLKFVIEYHSAMSYSIEEFVGMMKERGVDFSKMQAGYFEIGNDGTVE